jgi:hypothetical protein
MVGSGREDTASKPFAISEISYKIIPSFDFGSIEKKEAGEEKMM